MRIVSNWFTKNMKEAYIKSDEAVARAAAQILWNRIKENITEETDDGRE